MLHFRRDVLDERDGLLFLGGEPFTGVVYEIRGDRVVANNRVSDGVPGGPDAEWDRTRIRVLDRALSTVNPDEVDLLRPEIVDYLGHTLFKGVAYKFDEGTGRLLEEMDFDPSRGEPFRSWYRSGALREESHGVRPGGPWEAVSYSEDGQVKSVSSDRMGWTVTPEGLLRTLRLYQGYDAGCFRPAPLEVDSILGLTSRGVTDGVIESLRGLPRVERLSLDDTSITTEGLARFAVCTELRKLTTYANFILPDEAIRDLCASLPNCEWDRR